MTDANSNREELHLPAGFVSAAGDLPFREVRGMRNRLAHGYGDIDDELLWNTLDGALPQFVDELRAPCPFRLKQCTTY